VRAGTLQLGTSAGFGNAGGTVSVSNGATLHYYNPGSQQTIGNIFEGSGNLRFSGPGTSDNGSMIVNKASTNFSGLVNVQSGARVWLQSGTGLGSGAITVDSGGQIGVENVTLTNAISLTGNGWLEGAGSLGAIRLSGTTGVVAGPVTLAANSRIGVWNGSLGTVSGVISGTNKTLEKMGTGVIYLTGTNNFSGTYLHNGGVTVLNSANGPALFNGTNGTLVIGNTVGNNNNSNGGLATWRGEFYSTVEIYRTNQLGTNVDVRLNPTAGNAYLSLRGFDTVIGNLSGTNNGGAAAIIQNSEGETTVAAGRLTVTQTTNATFRGYVRDGNWNGGSGILAITKNGAATLTIDGIDTGDYVTYTGGTVVNEGRLVMRNTKSGGNFTNNNAFVDFFADGSVIKLAGGTLSGTGTYVKRGASDVWLGASGSTENISLSAGALIDVQQGTLRNEYGAGNWANNLGSLNIAAGANVNLWDSAGGITV
ncbi:MAG: hypothetical protein ACO3E8_07750, partial [Candidatus Methylacidiphilales bacterium]